MLQAKKEARKDAEQKKLNKKKISQKVQQKSTQESLDQPFHEGQELIQISPDTIQKRNKISSI